MAIINLIRKNEPEEPERVEEALFDGVDPSMEVDEATYDRLVRHAGCDELFDFYEISNKASELFENIYTGLKLPMHDNWIVHPTVLEDPEKVRMLKDAVRKEVVRMANEGALGDLLDSNQHDDYEVIKRILNLFDIKVLYESMTPGDDLIPGTGDWETVGGLETLLSNTLEVFNKEWFELDVESQKLIEPIYSCFHLLRNCILSVVYHLKNGDTIENHRFVDKPKTESLTESEGNEHN